MSECVAVETRLKYQTSFSLGVTFDAVREFVVTVRAEGFKTERAAIERADEATAAAMAAAKTVPQSGAVRRG